MIHIKCGRCGHPFIYYPQRGRYYAVCPYCGYPNLLPEYFYRKGTGYWWWAI